jgi:hypothetical protein
MKETYNGLPLIDLLIGSDIENRFGVNRLSFVENPATKMDWNLFNSKESVSLVEIKDEDKRLITTPIMLANTPILREIKGKFFYAKFSPSTIEEMMKKYFIQNKIHNINESHDPQKVIDGVFMVESFISGNRAKSSLYPNVEDGTWIGTFYVKDEKYWKDKIKGGNFTGISLEGIFDLSDTEFLYSVIENIIQDDKLSDDEKFEQISGLL